MGLRRYGRDIDGELNGELIFLCVGDCEWRGIEDIFSDTDIRDLNELTH